MVKSIREQKLAFRLLVLRYFNLEIHSFLR